MNEEKKRNEEKTVSKEKNLTDETLEGVTGGGFWDVVRESGVGRMTPMDPSVVPKDSQPGTQKNGQ